MFTQTLFYAWRSCQILQKQTEDVKAKWQTCSCPLLTKKNWESIENQLSSSGISSQDLHQILQRIQNGLQERNIEPEKFGDRIIFMSMFNDIEWTRKGNAENCISNSEKSRRTRRDSRMDVGRSWAVETKRSAMEIATTNLRENGNPSLHRWCQGNKSPSLRYPRSRTQSHQLGITFGTSNCKRR